MKNSIIMFVFVFVFLKGSNLAFCQQQDEFLVFQPNLEIDNGKKVVLISGDEEYRSEESMPMLAKILTKIHGFKSVVLFAVDPDTKHVNPKNQNNISGLHHLDDADLMVISTRFRQLPDNQMKWIDEYLKKGKPVVGLRTATHAFNYDKESKSIYKHYGYNERSEDWRGGFGRVVLGETWINHHGDHGTEGTRGLINGLEVVKKNPILKGVKNIWVPSDVYGIREDIISRGAQVLVYGQPTSGMNEEAPINWEKSIMPLAWTNTYSIPGGQKGRVFTTTMGASIDFVSEDLRRLVINACLWAVELLEPNHEATNVDIIGTFHPNMFGFETYQKEMYPTDFR